jgi:hypothetical protein
MCDGADFDYAQSGIAPDEWGDDSRDQDPHPTAPALAGANHAYLTNREHDVRWSRYQTHLGMMMPAAPSDQEAFGLPTGTNLLSSHGQANTNNSRYLQGAPNHATGRQATTVVSIDRIWISCRCARRAAATLEHVLWEPSQQRRLHCKCHCREQPVNRSFSRKQR